MALVAHIDTLEVHYADRSPRLTHVVTCSECGMVGVSVDCTAREAALHHLTEHDYTDCDQLNRQEPENP